jgi:flagellin-like protein
MRKLLKSKKALSPVVAAIILIAVTVAVSIAVAAWMGSLTIGFMETSELTISNMDFSTTDVINCTVTNSGTSSVTIATIKVNGATASPVAGTTLTYGAGDTDYLEITTVHSAGNKYSVSLFTTDGTLVGSYTDTA